MCSYFFNNVCLIFLTQGLVTEDPAGNKVTKYLAIDP